MVKFVEFLKGIRIMGTSVKSLFPKNAGERRFVIDIVMGWEEQLYINSIRRQSKT